MLSHFLAHGNSVARIATPSGITITAGPGRTNIAIPTAIVRLPTIETITFRQTGLAIVSRKRVLFIESRQRPNARDGFREDYFAKFQD